jgi:hypothetical protein
MTTVLKVAGDGSGTIEHRMLFSTAALAQLRQLAMLGGGNRRTADPVSEEQARALADSLGPGASYVTSTPIESPTGTGRDATYAFTDVSQLRLSSVPAVPGGAALRAQGLNTAAEAITFSMTREPNGNAVLHVHVPEPRFLDALGSPSAAGQAALLRTALAGARVLLVVEPVGALVRTSSPYVDGARVTLLEVTLDDVLKDDTLLGRLQAAATPDEARAVIKDVPGLKINLDRDVTVEFTPVK